MAMLYGVNAQVGQEESHDSGVLLLDRPHEATYLPDARVRRLDVSASLYVSADNAESPLAQGAVVDIVCALAASRHVSSCTRSDAP